MRLYSPWKLPFVEHVSLPAQHVHLLSCLTKKQPQFTRKAGPKPRAKLPKFSEREGNFFKHEAVHVQHIGAARRLGDCRYLSLNLMRRRSKGLKAFISTTSTTW
jgi:hypothetical protein